MNTTRLVIVPDETLEPLALALRTRLAGLAGALVAENLAAALGEQALRLLGRLDGGKSVREVIVWGCSGRAYLAGWTSLEPDEEVALAASADAEAGLVAQVFATQRAVALAGTELRAGDWTNLEARRGRALAWMAASPALVFDRCAAVVTLHEFCTDAAAGTPGANEVTALAEAADLAGRLIEDGLIRAALGLEAP